jgi:hypothetical protein
LAYGLPVHVVQAQTGITQRTLYRWKRQMRQKMDRHMAKKDSAFMTKLSQNSDFCHKDQNYCHKTADHCHKAPDHCHKNDQPCHKDMTADARVTQNDQAHPDHAISENSNNEDLTFIRAKLMQVVRDITNDLDHSGADINTRSLALSRLLDRIQWLDQLIDGQDTKTAAEPESEPATELEPHDFPGWLRPAAHRSDEQRAAEKAEIARRRAWAESQIDDDDFWGPANPA